MDVFTSIALNYLPKARVLASTLKLCHPEWKFHLYISDRNSANLKLDTAGGLFDTILWIEELDIENIYKWIFKHTVVETCTAVKGPIALSLLKRGAEKVMYIDPDIAVFNRLDEIDRLLDSHSVVLTPHLLEFEDVKSAVEDNEICALRHGVFNLGFFAVNNSSEGLRFADWFNQRLLEYCYADIPHGLFTDQRWCDLAPTFFQDLHILRDPGCNVASWNLSRRNLTFSPDGTLLVNGSPLKFYHFTGYDSGIGNVMTLKYSGGNHIVSEIWTWYGHQLAKHGQQGLVKTKWLFDCFENGERVPQAARLLYRQREDLQKAFPNPFTVGKHGGYYRWFMANGAADVIKPKSWMRRVGLPWF
ncbi:MAG: hypothetical protein ABSE08_03525 [Syntrophobacteraceae bacterium]|jgi:hypothetical protein